MKANNKDFEVIFVSSGRVTKVRCNNTDRDDESYEKYFGEMPWLSIAYREKMDRAKLAQALGIKGIPTLVLFDGKGRMITTEGRKVISMDQQGILLIYQTNNSKAIIFPGLICLP